MTINAAYSDVGWSMTEAERQPLLEQGIKVLTSVHTLGDDVNTAFDVKTPNVIVRETLYTFSQGMKVAVEIALMAADAGLLERRSDRHRRHRQWGRYGDRDQTGLQPQVHRPARS